VKVPSFPDGPSLVAQSLPLLRPKDWLFLPGWPALRTDPAPGLATRLTPKNPGRFDVDAGKPGSASQTGIRNPAFFDQLDVLMRQKAELAAKKARQGNDPKLWYVDVSKKELDRLEQGVDNSDLAKLLAKGREGKGHPAEPTIVRVSSSDGNVQSYFGYDWGYPFWREAATVDFKEKYVAWFKVKLLHAAEGRPQSFKVRIGFDFPFHESPPIPTEAPPPTKGTEGGQGWHPPDPRTPPREPPEGGVDVPVDTGD